MGFVDISVRAYVIARRGGKGGFKPERGSVLFCMAMVILIWSYSICFSIFLWLAGV